MKTIFYPRPMNCDVCGDRLTNVMFDAKTSNGQWGCLCRSCFVTERCKLGQGYGQQYDWDAEARGFVKVAG